MRSIPLGLLLIGGLLCVWASGCNPCAKLAKSKSVADKDSAAFCYYNRAKYESAALLFEELLGLYRGTPRAEVIMYNYAYARFNMGDYMTSGFYFNEFANQYPTHKNRENCLFMVARSSEMMSNQYQLDQQQTAKALEQYQNYVLMYPDGERKADASKAIGELRGKQAKKMYEHANLYLKVGKYQAAAITYKNLISDFPDSEYAPEAMIRMIRAQALFARNSVEDKKAVRYQEALAFYQRFKNRYPDSPKAANADKLKEQIDTEIKNIGTKQKKNKNDVFQ